MISSFKQLLNPTSVKAKKGTALIGLGAILGFAIQFGIQISNTSFLPISIGIIGFILGHIVELKTKRLEFGKVFFSILSISILSLLSPSGFFLYLSTGIISFKFSRIITIYAKLLERYGSFKIMNIVLALASIAFIFMSSQAFLLTTLFTFSTIILWSSLHSVARYIVYTAGRIFFKAKIEGVQNIDTNTGGLIVANHTSYLDFMILTLSIPRNLRFVMHAGVYEKKSLKWLFKKLNMIPVAPRGGRNDLKSFNEACQKQIENGHLVAIFGEGTVSRIGLPLEFKRGLEFISRQIGCNIYSVNIHGALGSAFTWNKAKNAFFKIRETKLKHPLRIDIGEAMGPKTTAFEVRNKIIELDSNASQKKIAFNETLVDHIKSNTNFKQALRIALRLEHLLKDASTVAIDIQNSSDRKLILSALLILGKTIQINSHRDEEPHFITITDSANSITKGSFIRVNRLIKEKTLEENAKFFTLKLKSAKQLATRFNNLSTKKSIAVISEGISYSHEFLIHKSQTFEMLFTLEKEDTVYVNDKSYPEVHKLLQYSLGLIKDTNIFTNDAALSKANFAVGLPENKHNMNHPKLKYIFCDDSEFKEIQDLKLENIQILKGFGIKGVTPIVALNIPNQEGKDIAGLRLFQKGNEPISIGRIFPGLAVKVHSVATSGAEVVNQYGKILIKGIVASSNYCSSKWIDTNLYGKIDEKGFIYLNA